MSHNLSVEVDGAYGKIRRRQILEYNRQLRGVEREDRAKGGTKWEKYVGV